MSSFYAVGIDLGTTLSSAAYVDTDGHTQMVTNSEHETLTPSIVLFDEDETIVGREARRARGHKFDRIAELAKRDMGQLYYTRSIGGKQLPPEVIQGCILRKIKRDISFAVGENFKVVVTVPAYFDEARRKATADAAEMSGLDIIDIVNEPTAAALAFGESLGYLTATGAPRDLLNLMVYDLGGGTFDVTIIRLEAGQVTTLATDGDVELGGHEWDMRLQKYVEENLQVLYRDLPSLDEDAKNMLRRAVEEAKHSLSARDSVTIWFDHAGRSTETQVTREQFERLTADLLERTAFTIRETLRESGLLWGDVDRVLLVGGSTRMPMVRNMIEGLRGIAPDVNVNPDEAVARGAAIYAAHRMNVLGYSSAAPGVSVTDVNSHSLGIDGVNQQTLRRENAVVIPRNTPLPIEVTREFVTRTDNQQTVVIQVLEGEGSVPDHCSKLGRAVIRHLPPGMPAGTKVDVHYRYKTNGRLSIDAHISGGGSMAQIELQRNRGMSDGNVSRWKNVVCKDGGFGKFDMALQEIVEEEFSDTESFGTAQEHETEAHMLSVEPAVPYGAPKAAADTLRSELSKESEPAKVFLKSVRMRRRNRFRTLVYVGGHIVASVLGLAIGYWILCLIRPSANFLDWNLPGLH